MNLLRKSLLLFALMFAASAAAVVLRPTHKVADQQPPVDLLTLIPKHFGDWHEEPQNFAAVVNPQQKEVLDKIYNQTLSRTYINAKGYRVMLSVAYGGDQSDGMQVHKPEICYPAQGFQLLNKSTATIALPFGPLLVTRVDTQLGSRREPITYWITVGDQVVQNGIHKKLVEMSYGFSGRIPDGMLVRVSSIDANIQRAYVLHDQLIADMLAAAASPNRARLVGILAK